MSPLFKGAMVCSEQNYTGQSVKFQTAFYFVFLSLPWGMGGNFLQRGHGVESFDVLHQARLPAMYVDTK